ncbi:hypothetical protein ACOMHN_035580 [Nucella lapillus]
MKSCVTLIVYVSLLQGIWLSFSSGRSPDNTVATCPVGSPLVLYPQPGVPKVAFCGRGFNRIDCPPTHYCNIHPADHYAVCCLFL